MLLGRELVFLAMPFCLFFTSGFKTDCPLERTLEDLEMQEVFQAPDTWRIGGSNGPRKRISLSGGIRSGVRNGVTGWDELEIIPFIGTDGIASIKLFHAWTAKSSRETTFLWEESIMFPSKCQVELFCINRRFLPCEIDSPEIMFAVWLIGEEYVIFAWPSSEELEVFSIKPAKCYRIFKVKRDHDSLRLQEEIRDNGKLRPL